MKKRRARICSTLLGIGCLVAGPMLAGAEPPAALGRPTPAEKAAAKRAPAAEHAGAEANRPGTVPVRWSGIVPDADGVEREVTFEGTIDGDAVSGTVMVDGSAMRLAGAVDRAGRFSGDVTLDDGRPVGKVSGAVHALPQTIAYSLGGRSGRTTAAAPDRLVEVFGDRARTAEEAQNTEGLTDDDSRRLP